MAGGVLWSLLANYRFLSDSLSCSMFSVCVAVVVVAVVVVAIAVVAVILSPLPLLSLFLSVVSSVASVIVTLCLSPLSRCRPV